MIHRLVVILFFSIFLLDFLKKYELIPGKLALAPELVSVFAMLIGVFAAAKRRTIDAPPVYALLGALFVFHVLCNVIVNAVDTGVIVAGLRNYFKFLPFFVLPMLFWIDEAALRTQFRLIVGFTLLQFPVALYQRLVESAGTTSGDKVGGTLVISSHLSIYLICFTAILLAGFLKQEINRKTFLFLLVATLLPTTINETKGTLIMLPFALLVPVLFNPGDPQRVRRVISFVLLGGLFLGAYIPIYDHFRRADEGGGIVSFMTDPEKLRRYLAPQTYGTHKTYTGRIDVLIEPIHELGGKPVSMFFGLGIGNVSDSALGERFTGEYEGEFATYLAFLHILWELGLFGLLLVVALWIAIAFDARKLSRRPDVYGVLGLGWLGVLCVLFISWFYKDIIIDNTISYLFWFYSGVTVAAAQRLSMADWARLSRVSCERPTLTGIKDIR